MPPLSHVPTTTRAHDKETSAIYRDCYSSSRESVHGKSVPRRVQMLADYYTRIDHFSLDQLVSDLFGKYYLEVG